MNLLIFNCGSSSQGFKVYQTAEGTEPAVIASGKARNVASQTRAEASIEWRIGTDSGVLTTDLPTQRRAAEIILALLKEHAVRVDAVGHRFVHGGDRFDRSVQIDAASLEDLRACLPFAPLHNPNSFSVIKVCLRQLPGMPQYAVFDTAFHAGMPEESSTYALPKELAAKHGYRKYGFHGLSYQYVSAKTAEFLGRPLNSLKLIMCHLGTGGSSVAALKDGHTLDTSMGYSPLPGLVMSTRSGDLDPEIALDLVRQGRTPDEVSSLLNNQSGLLGLSGYSSNLAEIIEAAAAGSPDCQRAYDVYAHRLSFYIGAFHWLLGGADCIVFTDDIGLHSWKLRERVCTGAEDLGLLLDREANRLAPADRPALITLPASKVQAAIVPTDEEIIILREVLALM
jgi:acetate kinase